MCMYVSIHTRGHMCLYMYVYRCIYYSEGFYLSQTKYPSRNKSEAGHKNTADYCEIQCFKAKMGKNLHTTARSRSVKDAILRGQQTVVCKHTVPSWIFDGDRIASGRFCAAHLWLNLKTSVQSQ